MKHCEFSTAISANKRDNDEIPRMNTQLCPASHTKTTFAISSNNNINNFDLLSNKRNIRIHHLSQFNLTTNPRWRLSFHKLNNDLNITKKEVITIKMLCVRNIQLFFWQEHKL